ncbi:MAG: aminopeptidase P family N-terminal domain-containing protein, partial [Nitratireductor sp.]|nr:aminopeptidase P family N-terminal domain-containing protein [Nitratireductor sp.]
MRKARLAEVKLPDFGVPDELPELSPQIFAARLSRLRAEIGHCGLDALVIYADREHCANIAWLTGFDPRFEEAVLVVGKAGDPVLLTGLENQGMGRAAPLPLEVRLYPPFGLMGQDRSATLPLADLLRDCGLKQGNKIGAAGWKYYGQLEAPDPGAWLEIPSFIADTLRAIAGPSGSVRNAGALLMDAESGLRAVLEIDELARFEFAACHVSEAVKRVVKGTRPGMREFEAASLMQPIGLPLSCHQMFSSGPRAWNGLPSPSSRVISHGEA